MFPVGVSAHQLSPEICSYRGGDAFFSYCPFSPHPYCFLVRKEIHQVLLLMDESPHTQEGMSAQSSRLLKAVPPAFPLFTADHCSITRRFYVGSHDTNKDTPGFSYKYLSPFTKQVLVWVKFRVCGSKSYTK